MQLLARREKTNFKVPRSIRRNLVIGGKAMLEDIAITTEAA